MLFYAMHTAGAHKDPAMDSLFPEKFKGCS